MRRYRLNAGDIVRLRKQRGKHTPATKSTVLRRMEDVRGGIVIDKPITGFRYWNEADLVRVKKAGAA